MKVWESVNGSEPVEVDVYADYHIGANALAMAVNVTMITFTYKDGNVISWALNKEDFQPDEDQFPHATIALTDSTPVYDGPVVDWAIETAADRLVDRLKNPTSKGMS